MSGLEDVRRLALCLGVAAGLAATCAAPATARMHCVMADEASARAAGDGAEADEEDEDEDAPPKFSRAFYKRTFTVEASLDGLDGRDLPISIESICGVPRKLAPQALQLAGADGVAVVYRSTTVFSSRSRLLGPAATAAVDGADTAELRVRLARPRSWREDEDGNSVVTFRTLRLDVTD